jgi:hypothetical protein
MKVLEVEYAPLAEQLHDSELKHDLHLREKVERT